MKREILLHGKKKVNLFETFSSGHMFVKSGMWKFCGSLTGFYLLLKCRMSKVEMILDIRIITLAEASLLQQRRLGNDTK
jgi:hypothetical protein